MPSVELIQAVAVTAELCGRTFSEAAARVFVDDLKGYDETQVIAALRRCRREVRGILTVQDVVSRLDDGRPGPDEAWALMPQDEAQSVVWTEEMAHAWGVAINAEDRMSQRLAFREAYVNAVNRARDSGQKPRWTASLGHSREGRERAVMEAVEKGRLTKSDAYALLPSTPHSKVLALIEPAIKAVV